MLVDETRPGTDLINCCADKAWRLPAAHLQIGMNTMMHLTCTNMSIEKLHESLEKV